MKLICVIKCISLLYLYFKTNLRNDKNTCKCRGQDNIVNVLTRHKIVGSIHVRGEFMWNYIGKSRN